MERTDSQKLAAIEAVLTRMEHRLFGNGQPGEIDHLHTRVSGVGGRVTKLENWRWWLLGLGFGIGMGSGAAGIKLMDLLGK